MIGIRRFFSEIEFDKAFVVMMPDSEAHRLAREFSGNDLAGASTGLTPNQIPENWSRHTLTMYSSRYHLCLQRRSKRWSAFAEAGRMETFCQRSKPIGWLPAHASRTWSTRLSVVGSRRGSASRTCYRKPGRTGVMHCEPSWKGGATSTAPAATTTPTATPSDPCSPHRQAAH
jgi:hypothetical protein